MVFVFFDRFKALCAEKGVSPKRAVDEIGLSNSLATKWKKTGATPQGTTLQRIAAYFSVTTDFLLEEAEEKPFNGAEMYEVIMKLCGKNEITGYQLCKDTGLQLSVLTDLKMGRKNGLSAASADKIARYFGVSVGFLLGTEKQAAGLNRKGEREMVRVRIPAISSLETAIRIFYEKTELSTDDVLSIFRDCSRTTAGRLKRSVHEQMAKEKTPIWNPACVNTEVAFRTWGLDIEDLERRMKKLRQLKLDTDGQKRNAAEG